MKYSVTVEGQAYEIEVSEDGQVWIDGELHSADLQPIAPPDLRGEDHLSHFALVLDERIFDALVDRASGNASWSVTIGGRVYDTRVQRQSERSSSLSPASTSAEPDGRILAPLPGLVLEVRVTAGQPVRSGEVLILLESMKMQLEVRSPLCGYVVESLVGPGLEVGQGQLLMILSPADTSADIDNGDHHEEQQ